MRPFPLRKRRTAPSSLSFWLSQFSDYSLKLLSKKLSNLESSFRELIGELESVLRELSENLESHIIATISYFPDEDVLLADRLNSWNATEGAL